MGQKHSRQVETKNVDQSGGRKSVKNGTPKVPSSEVSRHTQTSAIKMLWTVRLSPTLQVLSFNVLREICGYFPDESQLLISLQPYEVQVFDIATGQWQLLYPTDQNVVPKHLLSSVCVGNNRIFVCGMRNKVSIAYLLKPGKTLLLPHMSLPRRDFGILYDRSAEVIYVFGGIDEKEHICLRSSEKFLFSSNRWVGLPNMQTERALFNPCWYNSVVYLCGGWTDLIEQFDPRSNVFTLLPIVLFEHEEAINVVYSDSLVAITKSRICRIQKGGMTSQEHPEYSFASSCTPVVSQGVVYIVSRDTCVAINLENGSLMKQVKCGKNSGHN